MQPDKAPEPGVVRTEVGPLLSPDSTVSGTPHHQHHPGPRLPFSELNNSPCFPFTNKPSFFFFFSLLAVLPPSPFLTSQEGGFG